MACLKIITSLAEDLCEANFFFYLLPFQNCDLSLRRHLKPLFNVYAYVHKRTYILIPDAICILNCSETEAHSLRLNICGTNLPIFSPKTRHLFLSSRYKVLCFSFSTCAYPIKASKVWYKLDHVFFILSLTQKCIILFNFNSTCVCSFPLNLC